MRKFLALALVAVMCVFAASCSSSADSASASPEATHNTAEYYSTWTKSDWDAANPEEKELAVIFLVSEAAASFGSDEEVVQSIVNEAEETLTPEQYEDIENAITEYFDKSGDNANLQDSLHDVEGTISKYVAIG